MTLLEHAPGDRAAVVDAADGRVLTYAELLDQARALLAPLGDERRLVFLLAKNDLFSVLVYAGALTAGHPVVLLDPQTRPDALEALVEAYRPDWIADDGELRPLEGASDEPLHPDLAVLLSTSGTTGSRKLVRLSGANVESNARSIAELLELTPDERPITSLPIHYSFGLSVLNSHWSRGAAVVLSGESVLQKRFWSQVTEHSCTSFAGVPFTFQLLERAGFRTMDLPTLTTVQQAGGALDVELARTYAEHLAERGGRLVVMYGQTEATARMAYVPPERLLDKLGSAGVPVPGGRLDVDADGEVLYSGPNVMLGYATSRADLAKGDELGGVLHTGDLGRLDEDGYLFLSGRSARIAKVFGLRIDLDEVEAALRTQGPAVAVGGPDAVWGFCAFGTDESLAEEGRRLARRYRLHHTALRLRRIDAIPVTSSGKTDYEQVRGWTT